MCFKRICIEFQAVNPTTKIMAWKCQTNEFYNIINLGNIIQKRAVVLEGRQHRNNIATLKLYRRRCWLGSHPQASPSLIGQHKHPTRKLIPVAAFTYATLFIFQSRALFTWISTLVSGSNILIEIAQFTVKGL